MNVVIMFCVLSCCMWLVVVGVDNLICWVSLLVVMWVLLVSVVMIVWLVVLSDVMVGGERCFGMIVLFLKVNLLIYFSLVVVVVKVSF